MTKYIASYDIDSVDENIYRLMDICDMGYFGRPQW